MIKEAFKLQGDHQEFLRYMEIAYNKFAGEHALDVYVLCLSEHDDERMGMDVSLCGAAMARTPRAHALSLILVKFQWLMERRSLFQEYNIFPTKSRSLGFQTK